MSKYIYLFFIIILTSCKKQNIEPWHLTQDIHFTWSGGQQKVNLMTAASWEMSPIPDWISIKGQTRKEPYSYIYLSCTPNKGESIRNYKITFTAPGLENNITITQNPQEKLQFPRPYHRIDYHSIKLEVIVKCNINYQTIIPEDVQSWIISDNNAHINHIKPIKFLERTAESKNTITLKISENPTKEERTANVIISNQAYNLSDTLTIIQAGNPNEYYCDGSYIQLQKATKGNGVNLIFMGDGFTKEHLAINGKYEETMKKATEYFFSIEPFNSYRDFFNVYMVAAESEEEGVNNENGNRQVNNKFQSTFGNGTAISCNDDLCFEYARKIKELPFDSPITIIMPLNSNKFKFRK